MGEGITGKKINEQEIIDVMKEVEFTNIRTNGVRGKEGYCTLHHDARKRLARAVFQRLNTVSNERTNSVN